MQKFKTLDEVKVYLLTSANSTELDLFEVMEAFDHLHLSDVDIDELYEWFDDNVIRIKSDKDELDFEDEDEFDFEDKDELDFEDEDEFDFEEYDRYYDDSDSGNCELFAETIAIEDLNLSNYILRHLKNAGIMTLRDLKKKTKDDVKNIKNIGEKRLQKIQTAMEYFGFNLLHYDEIEDYRYLVEDYYDHEEDNDIDEEIEDSILDVSDESTLSTSDGDSFRDINDLNGYNNLWLKIKLSHWNISFTENSNKLYTEFELLYKSETGNILDELEFYITTKSGSHFKPTGYLTLTGEVPKKIDVWCDGKEHKLNIGPSFSIQKNDSIIEDGLRLTMSFKDIKQSFYVRKTYELQDGTWWHEEMFAIPLNKFNG